MGFLNRIISIFKLKINAVELRLKEYKKLSINTKENIWTLFDVKNRFCLQDFT